MSIKHLAKDAPLPERKAGVLRLYSMVFCPYSQRARLVLAHKKIPFEVVNINLKKKPSWFLEKNPNGAAPVVETDNFIMYESLIVSDWLNDVYSDNNLYADDANQRAKEKLLIEHCSKVTSAFYPLYRATPEQRPEILEKLFTKLDFYEQNLQSNFFGGDDVKMVDLMIWPWFERFPGLGAKLPADRFPKLTAWVDRMKTVPAVKQTMFSDEQHDKVAKEYYYNDDFDYDQFLEE